MAVTISPLQALRGLGNPAWASKQMSLGLNTSIVDLLLIVLL